MAAVLSPPAAMAVSSGARVAVAVPPADTIPIALMVDLTSGQTLYSREADRRFIPASLTKVMSLFTAFEMIKQGKITLRQPFATSDMAFREWSGRGSTMFLKAGSSPTLDELLQGISTVSANDACIVLAEGAAGSVEKWVALMNANARVLGMHDSHFGTPNGWLDEGRTYVSAHDLAILAQALLERHPALYNRYIGHSSLNYNGIAQRNHDPLVGVFTGADGIKTGFTRQAGYGYLGSAIRDGRRLVMVVAAANSEAARARASRQFMEWGFAAFENRIVAQKGAQIGTARVQNGNVRNVPLVAIRPINLVFPRGSNPQTTYFLQYQGPILAPIKAGQTIAELEIRVAGQPPYRVPLAAERNVVVANLWYRLRNGIMGLFS